MQKGETNCEHNRFMGEFGEIQYCFVSCSVGSQKVEDSDVTIRCKLVFNTQVRLTFAYKSLLTLAST